MANEEILTDYLQVGEEIVARLCDQVKELSEVLTPSTLPDMVESSLKSHAAGVIYVGDAESSKEGGLKQAKFTSQKWLVVVAVRHHGSQLQDTSQLRKEAGTIMAKTLRALQGWKPAAAARELTRIQGGYAPGYSATFGYYPFLFQCDIII